MPTVQEVLKQTGLTDEQINALDPKIVTGFTTVVTTAQQALDAAELAKRAQAQQYDQEIAPALDRWANEKADYETKLAAYEAAMKAAAEGGFKIPAIVTPTPPAARAADGKFVAGANTVPGSPDFVKGVRDELGGAFAFLADTTWKYRTLYGGEMPDPPTTIIREAAAQRMSPAEYAAKKYDFAGKEEAKRKAERQAEIDKAVKEAVSAKEKEFAEATGSNPMVRRAVASQFAEVQKAVVAKTRPDPLMQNREQRREATRAAIHKEIAAHETVQ